MERFDASHIPRYLLKGLSFAFEVFTSGFFQELSYGEKKEVLVKKGTLVAYSGCSDGEELLRCIVIAAREMGHEAMLIPASERALYPSYVDDVVRAEWVLATPPVSRYSVALLTSFRSSQKKDPTWWIENNPFERHRICANIRPGSSGIITSTRSAEWCEGFQRTIYLGYPATWKTAYEKITDPVHVVRGVMQKYVPHVGIRPLEHTDFLVHIVGSENLSFTNDVIHAVVDYARLSHHCPVVVSLVVHSRESQGKRDTDDLTYRQDLLDASPHGYYMVRHWGTLTSPFSSTGQILSNEQLMRAAGANGVVFSINDYQSMIAAMLAGIPAICVVPEGSIQKQADRANDRVHRFSTDLSHVPTAHGRDDVFRALGRIAWAEGRAELIAAERAIFPPPGPNDWMEAKEVVRVITGG